MIVTKTLEIELTPELLADAFCEFDTEEQALFFNEVARLAELWPGGSFMGQMSRVGTDRALMKRGRTAMEIIGEGAKK
jgi:hypothetical protein